MVCVIGVVSFNTNNQLNSFKEKLLEAFWTAYCAVYLSMHYRHSSVTATDRDDSRLESPHENILKEELSMTIEILLGKNNKADFLGCDNPRIRFSSEWKKRLLSYTVQLMCTPTELWARYTLQEDTAWREIDPDDDDILVIDIKNVLKEFERLKKDSCSYQISFYTAVLG